MKKSKNYNFILIFGILLVFIGDCVCAQQKQQKQRKQQKQQSAQVFIDADGDGYNDNAPDHDGDGIPNGLDPDWRKGQGRKMNYIDADGDGINDLIQNSDNTEFQNGNMNQNRSGESIMNDNQEKQKGHQRGKGNK